MGGQGRTRARPRPPALSPPAQAALTAHILRGEHGLCQSSGRGEHHPLEGHRRGQLTVSARGPERLVPSGESDKTPFLSFSKKTLFLSNLCTQRGARTHNLETESHALPTQLCAPNMTHFKCFLLSTQCIPCLLCDFLWTLCTTNDYDWQLRTILMSFSLLIAPCPLIIPEHSEIYD